MEKFERIPAGTPQDVLLAQGGALYQRFVKDQADKQVILPPSIRNRLGETFEGGNGEVNQSIFTEAREYVYITLRDDDLIRYINSDVHNKAYYSTPRDL